MNKRILTLILVAFAVSSQGAKATEQERLCATGLQEVCVYAPRLLGIMNSALGNSSGEEFLQSKSSLKELMSNALLTSARSCTKNEDINELSHLLSRTSVNLNTNVFNVDDRGAQVRTSTLNASTKSVGDILRENIEEIGNHFNNIKDRCTPQNSSVPNND